MIRLAAAMLLALFATPATAQQTWHPAPGATEIPLWPAGLAIAEPVTTIPEQSGQPAKLVAGKPWTYLLNVTRPTMVIYPPKGTNTGTAVMVFPGGGYEVLAMDLEGSEICDWLTAKGITCVLLKYRVPGSGPQYNQACKCPKEPDVPMALQDAQRAMGMIRQRAASLGIDPHRIGVIGFSAGGHLVVDISNHLDRAYAPVDEADRQPSRPDFAIALYPGHLWDGPGLALHPRNKVTAEAPPTLLIHAGNDPVDDVRHSLAYFLALQELKVPVELHVYPTGGHAFGLRPTADPITHWPALAEQWMATIGMLPSAH
jgi:acetyl esterase/lipase